MSSKSPNDIPSLPSPASNDNGARLRESSPMPAGHKIEVAELAQVEMVELHERLGKWASPQSRLGDGMRAREIDLEFRRPGGAFFVARSQGKLVGALAAGSLGLRGLVRAVWFDDTAPVSGVAWHLLKAALHEFEAARIMRVLAFLGSSSQWEKEVWKSWGFVRTEGTRLLTCSVVDARDTPKSSPGVLIRAFQRSEAGLVSEALRRAPEPGFEIWERQLLESIPLGRNRVMYVAWRDEEPVGALIGGTFGDLATVTHLWVRESERATGIGHHLISHALLAFTRAEAKQVHVMLASDYLASAPFWAALGFRENPAVEFVERVNQD